MGRLCGGAHEISGIPAPLCLHGVVGGWWCRSWVVGVVVCWVGGVLVNDEGWVGGWCCGVLGGGRVGSVMVRDGVVEWMGVVVFDGWWGVSSEGGGGRVVVVGPSQQGIIFFQCVLTKLIF